MRASISPEVSVCFSASRSVSGVEACAGPRRVNPRGIVALRSCTDDARFRGVAHVAASKERAASALNAIATTGMTRTLPSLSGTLRYLAAVVVGPLQVQAVQGEAQDYTQRQNLP